MSKKDDIIGAAIAEFSKYNYDLASINRIIKASGTSKGTFYHHFSDKKELYFAIIEKAIAIKQRYLDTMLEQVKQKDDIFEVLKAQAKAAAVFMREDPLLFEFGTRFASEDSSVRQEVYDRVLPQIGDSFSKIVYEGIANSASYFPLDFSVRIINFLTMHYFDILFDKGETLTIEKIEGRLNMLFDFLKRGLS